MHKNDILNQIQEKNTYFVMISVSKEKHGVLIRRKWNMYNLDGIFQSIEEMWIPTFEVAGVVLLLIVVFAFLKKRRKEK